MKATTVRTPAIYGSTFTMRNALILGGIVFLAPYFIRRLAPLFSSWFDVSLRDVNVASKDSVRDAADDLEVGGVSGKINRTVGRVTDHMGL